MSLERFATLAAISAVLHTKQEPVPSTLIPDSSELLPSGFKIRLDVEHMDRIAPSTLGQDGCPSANVVGKSILEGRGKKAKKHDDPVATVVCNGQLSFVQAVVQLLLAGPLYALLGTEMYKTFLWRPKSIGVLEEELANVEMRKLANLSAHIFSWLQGKPSLQVDISLLYDLEFLSPVDFFASEFIHALRESLRAHLVDSRDDCASTAVTIESKRWRRQWFSI